MFSFPVDVARSADGFVCVCDLALYIAMAYFAWFELGNTFVAYWAIVGDTFRLAAFDAFFSCLCRLPPRCLACHANSTKYFLCRRVMQYPTRAAVSRLATVGGNRRGGIFIEIARADGESSSEVSSSESESDSSSASQSESSSESSSDSDESQSSGESSSDSDESQSSSDSESPSGQSSSDSEPEEGSESSGEAHPPVRESSDDAAPGKRANEFDDIGELLGRLRKKSRLAFQQDSECCMEADVDELHKRFWSMSSAVTKLRDVTAMLVSS